MIVYGTLCLGILIGILIAYFVFEVKVMDRRAIYSSVGVMAGAGVIAIFHLLSGSHVESLPEYWLYPVGLLVGFVLGTVEEWILPAKVWEAKLEKRIKVIKDAELTTMNSLQSWAFLLILLVAVSGGLWVIAEFYVLSENRAWLACIKENDQASAQNLVCRSQYPESYQRFVKEFQGK